MKSVDDLAAHELALFHHCPTHGDDRLDTILRDARELSARMPLTIDASASRLPSPGMMMGRPAFSRSQKKLVLRARRKSPSCCQRAPSSSPARQRASKRLKVSSTPSSTIWIAATSPVFDPSEARMTP